MPDLIASRMHGITDDAQTNAEREAEPYVATDATTASAAARSARSISITSKAKSVATHGRGKKISAGKSSVGGSMASASSSSSSEAGRTCISCAKAKVTRASVLTVERLKKAASPRALRPCLLNNRSNVTRRRPHVAAAPGSG